MANNKLVKQYCVNLDADTGAMLERLAELYQRKPSELIRLLIAKPLRDEWSKVQREEHPENQEQPQPARFGGGVI